MACDAGLSLSLVLVLFVGRVRDRQNPQGRGENQDRGAPHCFLKLHSTSPCSVRSAIFFSPRVSAISAAIASTGRLPVAIFNDALE